MVRWLTRLFKPHVQADNPPAKPATLPPPPAPQPVTTTALAVIQPPVVDPPVTADPAGVPADSLVKETCPECGRTSVFAGPPGHRYCMHCALRSELFDRSASV